MPHQSPEQPARPPVVIEQLPELERVPDAVVLAVWEAVRDHPALQHAAIHYLVQRVIVATYDATDALRGNRTQADRDARALRQLAWLVNGADAITTVLRLDDVRAALRARARDPKPAGEAGTDTPGGKTT